MLDIVILPALTDNYIYVIHDKASQDTVVVDPALAAPVIDLLQKKNWRLNYIFNTHHHWDHVGGNLELKQKTGCKIIGGSYDRHRIPGIDQAVGEVDKINVGAHQAQILGAPGHTLGHIIYYFADDNTLFCGDTLFVMGCGRLFEGTAEQMWRSLQQLKTLPVETKIYCTHEYSQNNGRFALTLEPQNQALQAKMAKVNTLCSLDQPTIPSSIGEELATNPFLREDSLDLQKTIGMVNATPVEIFAKVRELKDRF